MRSHIFCLTIIIVLLMLPASVGASEVSYALQARLNLDGTWMYQNVLESTNSNLTATASIISDPAGNSSYTYDWEFILPDDVSVAPTVTYGGGPADVSCNFAAPSANQPQGLSDSGQAVTVRVTVTGDDYDNTGSAEAQFGIALLGDVNNDAGINVADRTIINAFWRTGSAGAFTLLDCDINCNGSVNVADRSIANAVWRGVLGQNSVSQPCPLRSSEPEPVVESAWPTLGADSARSGLSNEAGPEVGCVKWEFATDGALYTSASIGAEGRVHIASEDGKLYTVDPNTAAAIWIFDANSPMTSSPTVGPDGTVYVGCMNGRLYAIDKDGNLRWTHDTGAFIYSTPAIAASDDGEVYFGSQDGKLYALGADGSELWTFETAGPGQVGGAILTAPAIGRDGSVYIAGVFDSNLYALDPNDGTIRWVHDFRDLVDSNDFEGLPFASPAAGPDGTIYMLLPNPVNLYALSPADGSIMWVADGAEHLQRETDKYLQGHWEFEGDTSDSSGNGRDGVLTGDVSIVTDPYRGNVLFVDNGHVVIPDYKGITGTDPRTITAWIKTSTDGCLVSWGSDGVAGEVWKISTRNFASIQVHVPAGSVFTPDNDIFGEWHHVVVVWENDGTPDAADVKFYLDGFQTSTQTNFPESPMPVNTGDVADVWIGASPSSPDPTTYFRKIDDFRIYDRALTAAEIFGMDPDAYCWQRPAIGPDGTIYVSFDDNYLRAFNPDGSVKWVKRVGIAGGFTLAVDKDGLIYAASEDGSLYVMNSSGVAVSRLDGRDWLSQPVIGEDGTIYVCDIQNNVLAIDRYGCEGPTVDLHWAGDFNSDGVVDFDDLLILAFDWMQYGSSTLPRASDADRDMYADLFDFAAVVAKWLDEI